MKPILFFPTVETQVLFYLPGAPAFAAGIEMATESGCVQTAVPLVKSRRCMVIFSLA